MIFNLIGSLGLFLLGMWLMTEGLKLAGGHALERLLSQWTSTRVRGLFSGILITSLVQSSSAVTVATLGFVNAGLMSFQQAIWVVFGSNVGTTFTAWIITLFGFSFKINALTFPLIGIGAGLRLFAPHDRGKSLGMALSGFGLLFMGIDALNTHFSDYAQHINLDVLQNHTGYATVSAVAIGFVLTLLTQSSSAAIALILTAVASGITHIDVAAAAVIGANIGTTSTALIASIGATAGAKRLAWAHVAFNLLTGIVALASLPLFWSFTASIARMANMENNHLVILAIFHTCFNVLGIILMWPLEPWLSKKLASLYQPKPSQSTGVVYLDANAAMIPDLAIRAMTKELETLLLAIDNLALPIPPHLPEIEQHNVEALTTIEERIKATNDFISLSLKSGLTGQQGEKLSLGLTVSHYLSNACSSYSESLDKYQWLITPPHKVPKLLDEWFVIVNEFNHIIHHGDEVLQQEKHQELNDKYNVTKTRLLQLAINEKLNIGIVDTALQGASFSRRYIDQIAQASQALNQLLTFGDKDKEAVLEQEAVPVIDNNERV